MLSPSAPDVPASFLGWLERMDGEGRIFLSAVTVHEIEKGIALLDRKGATARAAGLRGWRNGIASLKRCSPARSGRAHQKRAMAV